MLNLINNANNEKTIDALLISLEAKKAFYSLCNKYIKKCLTAFGLGEFVKIFETVSSVLA